MFAPALLRQRKPRLTLLIEPRFSGGTSHAVAKEISLLRAHFDLRIVGLKTAMFRDREIAQPLAEALSDAGLELTWAQDRVVDQIVVLHNPSALRFNPSLDVKILCEHFITVAHENFCHPTGVAGFDVAHVFGLLDQVITAKSKQTAPVSPANRATIIECRDQFSSQWQLTEQNWVNIHDGHNIPATRAPKDRRGRHSRPGYEKFPSEDVLLQLFPPHAEACRIMGAESLQDSVRLAHCDLLPFNTEPVSEFLQSIDFFVYFTHPSWQESFGRVIAEAIEAGKVVLTDPRTAENFGDGVLGVRPDEVDNLIQSMIQTPDRYVAQAERGQSALARFSDTAFEHNVSQIFDALNGGSHSVL